MLRMTTMLLSKAIWRSLSAAIMSRAAEQYTRALEQYSPADLHNSHLEWTKADTMSNPGISPTFAPSLTSATDASHISGTFNHADLPTSTLNTTRDVSDTNNVEPTTPNNDTDTRLTARAHRDNPDNPDSSTPSTPPDSDTDSSASDAS